MCNSQKVLGAIALFFISQEDRFLRGHVYQEMEELQQIGHPITFQWVSGHFGLIGNEKADLSARNRAEKSGKLTERWSSLAYIRRNITEMKMRYLTKWHERETQDREASRCGYYVTQTKRGISLTLENVPKKYALRYY